MAHMKIEIIIPLNYVALYKSPGTLQPFDPPADLWGPKEAESIFHKLSPPVKSPPTPGRKIGGQQGSEWVNQTQAPEQNW